MSDIDDPAMTPPEIDEPAEPADTSPKPSTGMSWLAGAIGAAVALSFGQFVARFSDSITSLVIGVGEWLIELTPGDVVSTSINNIGTLQKPLLLGGITLASIALGGWLGVRQRTNAKAVPLGFGFFGLLGGFTSARSELTNAAASWAVALTAAALGALTAVILLAFARRAERSAVSPDEAIIPGAPLSQSTDRRHVLAYGSAAAGAVALAAVGQINRTSAAELAREQILTDASTTTSTVPGASSTAPAQSPIGPLPVGEFDGIQGISSYITPISPEDEFYLIDTALQKPEVDPSTWTLTINGEYVDTPVTYTYEELLARPMVDREVTLSCVSNPVGGNLVGNALWSGIPLTELFEEAGIQDPTNGQHQVFSRSVDGFTCGFPVPLAYDGRTAMLALKMNGEPLPIIHGFPARLVIAGLYGYVSATKWVEEISITDWIGVDGFWMPRGWSKEGPIKTQSRIDVPANRSEFAAGKTTLGGIAWSPTIGIDKVEVYIGMDATESIEDDSTWTEVELANVESDESWVQWRHEWEATPGDWLLRVRATDKDGVTQSPIPVAPAPNGAEGYATIVVRVA